MISYVIANAQNITYSGCILGCLGPLLFGLPFGLVVGLIWELGAVLLSRWTYKRSALSSRLIFIWPSTRQRRHDFIRNASRRLFQAMIWGLLLVLVLVLGWGRYWFLIFGWGGYYPVWWLSVGLLLWVLFWLLSGLIENRPVLITSRTPTEARSRSLITALLYMLIPALVVGLYGLANLVRIVRATLEPGGIALEPRGMVPLAVLLEILGALLYGVLVGLFLGLNNGGWFVLLQKIAHRRLARDGNLSPNPYDFLEWGVEQQIFRRVGGGVRFRHNLIQQHLANASAESGG
jgi:hypothetical protein